MKLYIIQSDQPFVSGDGKALIKKFLPANNTMTVSSKDKPLLSSGYVSVSHTQHMAVVIFSAYPVGIDIEKKKELSSRLIERLQLKEPYIESWVLREAAIKLFDEPSYLFTKDVNAFSKIISFEAFLIGIMSTQPIEIEDIIYA